MGMAIPIPIPIPSSYLYLYRGSSLRFHWIWNREASFGWPFVRPAKWSALFEIFCALAPVSVWLWRCLWYLSKWSWRWVRLRPCLRSWIAAASIFIRLSSGWVGANKRSINYWKFSLCFLFSCVVNNYYIGKSIIMNRNFISMWITIVGASPLSDICSACITRFEYECSKYSIPMEISRNSFIAFSRDIWKNKSWVIHIFH